MHNNKENTTITIKERKKERVHLELRLIYIERERKRRGGEEEGKFFLCHSTNVFKENQTRNKTGVTK